MQPLFPGILAEVSSKFLLYQHKVIRRENETRALGVWEARELLWGHREISTGAGEQMLLKQETGSQNSRKRGIACSQVALPWDYNRR